VHCMRKWLREGKDLRTMLPLLGAYLGHVSLASTEAYLAVRLRVSEFNCHALVQRARDLAWLTMELFSRRRSRSIFQRRNRLLGILRSTQLFHSRYCI
jgi:hypothetical protein